MNKKDIKNKEGLALLPNGFVDLLPPFAEKEAHAIQILMHKFAAFDYQRIKPPLLEFEDSILAPGPGAALASETFRLMDPVTHRMLGVRSDVTPQISRIVASRLSNEERPLRLMYANDVLRTRGSQMRTERQFVQVGCEYIGGAQDENGELEADLEIAMLAILGLNALGVKDITLDLTVPGFVAQMLRSVEENDRADIEKAVEQRDVKCLSDYADKDVQVIAQAIRCAGAADKALAALDALSLPAEIKRSLTRLNDLVSKIERALEDLKINDVTLTIDMVEGAGFEYHSELGFTLFSQNICAELGRGGCYQVRFGQEEGDEIARGFTLYLDTIVKAVEFESSVKKIMVPAQESWSAIQDLQEQGWTVVRAANKADKKDAENTGCTHIYKDQKIQSIK